MLFALSLLWATVCSGDADVRDVPALRLAGVRTPAEVRNVEPTQLKVSGEPVVKVTYAFKDGDREFSRSLHDFDGHWRSGQAATALYLKSDPEVSRLQGERRGHSGLFGSFLFFVPFAAVILGFPSWRKGLRDALLLREGLTAEAEVTEVILLTRPLRGVQVSRCSYEFESLWGEMFRGASVVPSVTVAERRPVLYLPRDAGVSTLVDALPMQYGLRVNRFGEWEAGLKALPVAASIMAAASVAAAMGFLILQATGILTDLGR